MPYSSRREGILWAVCQLYIPTFNSSRQCPIKERRIHLYVRAGHLRQWCAVFICSDQDREVVKPSSSRRPYQGACPIVRAKKVSYMWRYNFLRSSSQPRQTFIFYRQAPARNPNGCWLSWQHKKEIKTLPPAQQGIIMGTVLSIVEQVRSLHFRKLLLHDNNRF